MKRIVLGSKIHRAAVTESVLDYEGSLGLDGDLMKAAGMIPFEQVHVYNISNGERFSTYLIKAKEGSGTVAVYGAAAHKAKVGDKLIVVSYVLLEEEETEFIVPRIVILDEGNRIKEVK
ncbi:MAG: aspartate 1-decarboxylase [Candidatus Aminicenantes bacterium]|nr:aspartate 1-decarboxylase [Candidatus Aminicenantes bacterium]